MNAKSIAYSHIQNQHSSMTDDIFNLSSVNGVTPMLPNQKNLDTYSEQLVSSYATFINEQYELTLDMLPHDEQNKLAQLYIESIDRDIEYAYYGSDESINSDFLCALLAMLQDDCPETRKNFAEITRKNILIYYQNILNEILEIACNNFLYMQMNECNLYAHQDLDHGDVTWRNS